MVINDHTHDAICDFQGICRWLKQNGLKWIHPAGNETTSKYRRLSDNAKRSKFGDFVLMG
jgi:hypothetical protein